ncbi:MAG TPA: DUF6498-containing protein [Vicinamibacterales bacterium]
MEVQERKATWGRIRIRWRDDAAGATPLELPERRLWPVGLILGAMFAIFAGIAWMMVGRILGSSVRDVFDLMFVLFEGFWLLGWSVAVVILGALTVLLFFYSESARLQDGRLVHVPRLGPLNIIVEYDLARVRNVRLENAGGDNVRIRFDYDGGTNGLGDVMPRPDAELAVRTIRSAVAALRLPSGQAAGPAIDVMDVVDAPTPAAAQKVPHPPPLQEPDVASPSITSRSGLALIAANLVPLAGVLFFGWDLASVVVLFWAESAVIAFYTVLKMSVVGKFAALLMVPFFVGHFGGFMAGHFLLIYALFVRGATAAGPAPGAREALQSVFSPLWIPLAALFISHGVSFFDNFLGRREYAGTTMNALMVAPYNRIVVMQIALIFGGWIILLLKSPVPALALLILLKMVLDFTAHRKEHGA